MTALISGTVESFSGDVAVPGDKSISHRALMIGAMATGETLIEGLLEGEDVLRTADALRALGAGVDRLEDGTWRVRGVGPGGLATPDDVLDLGNSGTSARLLLGLVATHPITAHITGDASLRRRPMGRVTEPLSRMGARFEAREGGLLPLMARGAEFPLPIEYELPVPSAQIKSAVLLAGLNTPGETTVVENLPSRDHTERMLRYFGMDVRITSDGAQNRIVLPGRQEVEGRPISVPGDPSSASFPGVAALIVPGSEVTVRNVGLNPLRAGLFTTLEEMGANFERRDAREVSGEPVADLVFRFGPMTGVTVPADRAPSMIDEYPILAVAAAFATGETRMRGLAELRVKESDRLAAIADGLAACGVTARIDGDDLIIQGQGGGGPPPGGGTVAVHHDHRIAMSFLVMGLGAERPVTVDDGGPIATSFPGFVDMMNGLGAAIRASDAS